MAGSGSEDSAVSARRERLALLARTDLATLIAARDRLHTDMPAYRVLKQPENGLAMVRARAGGTGAPFHFGEMTVSRCVVALEGGPIGVGYVAGRDRRKVELVALFDALAQQADWAARIDELLLRPERDRQLQQRAARAAAVATTKVDFFTLVRGED